MQRYVIDARAGENVLREAVELARRGAQNTADLLARIAVIDEHRLYLPAGHSSLFAWCMSELPFSENSAEKRICAARVARQFPALFEAIADGRLHLAAVVMLAPHLTPESVEEWIAAAARKTKSQIERLIADSMPRTTTPDLLATTAPDTSESPAPGRVIFTEAEHSPGSTAAPEQSPGPVAERTAYVKLTPLPAGWSRLEAAIDRETDALLREAQDLLGHAIPSRNLASVLHYCLRRTVAQLRRRKFGEGAGKRGAGKPGGVLSGRHLPPAIREAVARRDERRCTFVSPSGRRCASTTRLEFDHVVPVARGGQTSVDNLRLRCRAHNQYSAEQDFGETFMRSKRERKQAPRTTTPDLTPEQLAKRRDLAFALKNLGFRNVDVKEALSRSAHKLDAPLETLMREALTLLAPTSARKESPHSVPLSASPPPPG